MGGASPKRELLRHFEDAYEKWRFLQCLINEINVKKRFFKTPIFWHEVKNSSSFFEMQYGGCFDVSRSETVPGTVCTVL